MEYFKKTKTSKQKNKLTDTENRLVVARVGGQRGGRNRQTVCVYIYVSLNKLNFKNFKKNP